MEARIKFFILICMAALTSACFAQEGTSTKAAAPADANVTSVPSFPYVAEIIGDDVYIRSGPGTNYYPCSKLSKADKVTVAGSQFGWSRIVPPAGSFSWISTQYVSIDPSNPNIGIVTGDGVRVYVGSDYRELIRSTTTQLKLNKGEKVRLMGEKKGGYYRIVPPTGAYRWVSTKYIKALGPVGEVPLPVGVPAADTGAIVPKASKLEEYYALEKQMKAEQAKPIAQQNYTDIKKALLEIAGNKKAGKATRYSEFAIKQIERSELALEVAKAVRLQDGQLQQISKRIAKARAKRLEEAQDLGRFAVVGKLRTSNIYGREAGLKYYRIIDDSGKTVCYSSPTGAALKMDLSKFIDRKVGLIGTIEPHPQTAGALVRFTEVVELK